MIESALRNALIVTLASERESRRAIAKILAIRPTTVDGVLSRHRRKIFRHEYMARRQT